MDNLIDLNLALEPEPSVNSASCGRTSDSQGIREIWPTSTDKQMWTIVCAVLDDVRKLLARKKLSANAQQQFSIDLVLVALSIRTGHLVDTLSPEKPVCFFSGLLCALRTNPLTKYVFATVVHLYEPTAGQSFFVNIQRLSTRIRDVQGPPNAEGAVIFVSLEDPFKILHSPPAGLREILDQLSELPGMVSESDLPLSLSLSHGIHYSISVPLAAVLLDYHVAYVPTLESSRLTNISLDFFEATLTLNPSDDNHSTSKETCHTFLKFSCPTALTQGSDLRLAPQTLVERLRATLVERFQSCGNGSARITVRHERQTIQHVVF